MLNKICNITNLAGNTALTTVEYKITNVSNLVKKLAITQKGHDHDKYITTQDLTWYSKMILLSKKLSKRLKQYQQKD